MSSPLHRTTLGFRPPQVHIDLRYVLKDLGYTGGLKAIERRFGMAVTSWKALTASWRVLLWREYRRSGNEKALETLLAYNVQDVLNLEVLMVRSYNLNLKVTPFSNRYAVKEGSARGNPFRAHREVIERCLRW